MNDNDLTLAPCPFCQSDRVVVEFAYNVWRCYCCNCGAVVNGMTNEQVIDDWNLGVLGSGNWWPIFRKKDE